MVKINGWVNGRKRLGAAQHGGQKLMEGMGVWRGCCISILSKE